MPDWFRNKLDHITKEFLDGGGYGAVFEASFIAYLECLLVHRGGQPVDIWGLWTGVCKEATPEDEPVQCLSNRVPDREELVKALQNFRGRFDGPTRHSLVVTSEAQLDPLPRSTETGGLDLFDLLTGDNL
jgi:hypothetical protein